MQEAQEVHRHEGTGKLESAASHPTTRPRVLLFLNGDTEGTLSLVDTGASRTLIRWDVARELMSAGGQRHIRKCSERIISLTGNALDIVGEVELQSQVGPLRFVIVKDLSHEAILGYDQLARYGFQLNESTLTLGTGTLGLLHAIEMEVCEIDVDPDDCIGQVVSEYKCLFGSGSLPTANLPPIKIETLPGHVVCKRPYRTPLAKRLTVETEVRKMLDMGIIRPSASEWSSPVTLVPKKDGTTRFCIDYRAVNDVTIKDRYPLPLIADIFDTLGGSSVFTTLDLRSGYWQLPVEESSIHKTSFVCHVGQYEFISIR